jgi:hypothetical protein
MAPRSPGGWVRLRRGRAGHAGIDLRGGADELPARLGDAGPLVGAAEAVWNQLLPALAP